MEALGSFVGALNALLTIFGKCFGWLRCCRPRRSVDLFLKKPTLPLLVVQLGPLHLLESVLPCQGCGRIVDPRNVPSLICVLSLDNAFSAQVLDKVREARPLCGVHVSVVAIRNVFLVDLIGADPSSAEPSAEQLHELLLKGCAEVVDDLLRTA